MLLNENLRDIFTNRSLRLAIDSIFSIILLFSDRIFILAAFYIYISFQIEFELNGSRLKKTVQYFIH